MAPTFCRHAVSGSISLPFRGSFHLSLTVLVRYRSPEYLALGGGPPEFTRAGISRVTWGTAGSLLPFAYGAFTLYGGWFHAASTGQKVCMLPDASVAASGGPHDPDRAFGRRTFALLARHLAGRLARARSVWASPLSLAATQGVAFAFLSSRYLDDSFPWVPSPRLSLQREAIKQNPALAAGSST